MFPFDDVIMDMRLLIYAVIQVNSLEKCPSGLITTQQPHNPGGKKRVDSHRTLQVRVEGVAEPLSEEQSEKYFHGQPRAMQISNSIGQNSTVVKDAEVVCLSSIG